MNDEEIGCNSLDLMELGVKKHQKQIKSESLTLEDNECEKNQTCYLIIYLVKINSFLH